MVCWQGLGFDVLTMTGQSAVAVFCACALTLAPSATSRRLGLFGVVVPRRIYHAGISNMFPQTNRGHSINFPTSSTSMYIYNIPYMDNPSNYQVLYNPTAVNPVAPRFRQTAARFQAPPTSRTEKDVEDKLPVIGFQSSQWVWPNAEVTGPLRGIPSLKHEDESD